MVTVHQRKTPRLLPEETPADFALHNHGNIFIFVPLSEAATNWCDEHLEQESLKLGSSYVVDHRCMTSIIDGVNESGLSICGA